VAYRRELLAELHRTLAAFGDGGFASLEEAAWVVRNRTRVAGRAAERRVVSRTLLVKGLEFEHVVLCAADELDAKNLYVALTRGSRSVTVVARSPVLHASR
jgi:DNA helicase-2/ATP-dependent DNA helicase PcrA